MSLKKYSLLGLVMIAVSGCLGGNDDVLSYDPIAQLEIDIKAIDAYLAANNIQAEVQESTGIRYVITQTGNDVNPAAGNFVAVDYELYNLEGELLDTSIESIAQSGGIHDSNREYVPLEFQIGTNGVISGFQYATLLLDVGGKGDFYIPSVWAYQNRTTGNIGPNENLKFVIELKAIDP